MDKITVAKKKDNSILLLYAKALYGKYFANQTDKAISKHKE
jgi:hypothetical protein